METSKPLLVFDCFGVVLSEVANIWQKRYLNEAEIKERREIGKISDAGDITTEETFQRYGALARQSATEVQAEWDEIARVDWDVIGIITQLREQGYRLVMLSNSTSGFLHDRLQALNIAGYFNRIFCSSEMGVIKPHPEIFEMLLDQTGVAPQDAIMIDDRQYNIDGAHAVGMQAILFTDATSLKKALDQLLS